MNLPPLLLLLLNLLPLALPYRYLTSQPLSLPYLPTALYYLSPQTYVAQDGPTISVYNTTTNQLLQSLTADSDTPDIQTLSSSRLLLLNSNNHSVVEVKQPKAPQFTTIVNSEQVWTYKIGKVDNSLVIHQMSSREGNSSILILDADHLDQHRIVEIYDFGGSVVAGSNVQVMSNILQEYYFVSGGQCSAEDSSLYLFRGQQYTASNIYNFTVPECDFDHLSSTKLQLDLSSFFIDGKTRHHALTYTPNTKKPSQFITQVIRETTNTNSYQEYARFDTHGLIGVQLLQQVLQSTTYAWVYTADTVLCRATIHRLHAYETIAQEDSFLPSDVIQTVLDYTHTSLLGLTATQKAYLFELSGKLVQTTKVISNPEQFALTEAVFYSRDGIQCIVFRDSNNQLTVFDNTTKIWQKGENGPVIDYCLSDGTLLFTLTDQNQDNQTDYFYQLGAYQIDPQTFGLVELDNAYLELAVSHLLCLPGGRVLTQPSDGSKFTRVWEFSTSLEMVAFAYLPLYQKVYRTESFLYFMASDYSPSLVFYSFDLKPAGISGMINKASKSVHKVIETNNEHIIFAVGGSPEHLLSLDHYLIINNQQLRYWGSFPLSKQGLASVGRVVVLPDSDVFTGTVIVDYLRKDGNTQVRYEMGNPPLATMGIFEDAATEDCSSYSQARFRMDYTRPDQVEMFIVNGEAGIPFLERYVLEGDGSSYLASRTALTLFSSQDLTIQLNSEARSLLVEGTRAIDGSKIIQMRNINNISDILLEKVYSDLSENENIESYVLFKDTIFAVASSKNTEGDHYTKVLGESRSGSKVPVSDREIGEVGVYAGGYYCDYIAVSGPDTGSAVNNPIYFIYLDTGSRVRAPLSLCKVVNKLSLSGEGTLLGYLCNTNQLCVYNIMTAAKRCIQNPYSNITAIRVLSEHDVVLPSIELLVCADNQTYHISIPNPSNAENEAEYVPSRAIKRSQNNQLSSSAQAVQMREINAVNTDSSLPAIDYKAQVYALISDSKKVIFSNFQGSTIDSFSPPADQAIVSIAFTTTGTLSVVTDSSILYTLTSDPCPANQSIVQNYCLCDPSFDNSKGLCRCSPQHIFLNGRCQCEEGRYFVSPTVCADCSVLCSTCSGGGAGSCDSYSAVFVVMIVFLALAGVGIVLGVVWLIRRKGEKKARLLEEDLSDKDSLQKDGS